MEIRKLTNRDLEAVKGYLQERISTCMIPLNNVLKAGLEFQGRRFEGQYVGSFENGALKGVAAVYWNGMLAVGPDGPNGALAREAVRHSSVAISGMLGAESAVDAATDSLGVTAEDLSKDSREDLFELDLEDLVIPDNLSSGEVRARQASEQDEDLITKWRVAYCVELFGRTDDESLWKEVRATVTAGIGEGSWWLLEENGKLVSKTGFNARVPGIVQIGGVYTPPEYRSRGYARAAVAASLLSAREAGDKRSILFTGRDQVAAQRAYRSIGFSVVGDFRLVVLKPGAGPKA